MAYSSLTEIYPKVISIAAQKRKTHRNCDAECRRNGHLYKHEFETPARLLGLPDGSSILLPDGREIELSDGSMLVTDYD
jgi:hypothetical protein